MACPAIITGDRFLSRVLQHIDCQAQNLGAFGYQSLGEPGSTASALMIGLLTVFVALYGIRLLFGPAPGGRNLVFDGLKVGIVLTLAFSWPAFQTVIYDVVLKGPAEIAANVSPPTLPQNDAGFAQRLQDVDNAIVDLTVAGTGRNTGQLLDTSPSGSFAGTALQDETAFGWARLAWLASVIGSLALLRLVAGLLLALAPIAAGLLLFDVTRGLFAGWLRGLVIAMLGAIGATVVLAVELAIVQPWLADALRLRDLGYATPSAPIELFAITLAFTFVQFGMLWLLAKVAFASSWRSPLTISWPTSLTDRKAVGADGVPKHVVDQFLPSRAERIASTVERTLRDESSFDDRRLAYASARGGGNQTSSSDPYIHGSGSDGSRLGSSWRRTSQRRSVAKQRRDTPQ